MTTLPTPTGRSRCSDGFRPPPTTTTIPGGSLCPGHLAQECWSTGYATAQFTVTFGQTQDLTREPESPQYGSPTLWGHSDGNIRDYRVRYVNPGADDDGNPANGPTNNIKTDDVPGDWETIRIPLVSTNHQRNADVPDNTSTLPIIIFDPHQQRDAGAEVRVQRRPPAGPHRLALGPATQTRGTGQDQPNGYVIDRSPDDGATWEILHNADTPRELGTADTFTDSPSGNGDHEVMPGHEYTYRVFPVFLDSPQNAYGIPAIIMANSEGAALPGAAEAVTAEGAGTNSCVVKWLEPADDGGHPVRGYLIQVAEDDDGEPGEFRTIDPDAVDMPFTVMGADTMTFTYTGSLKHSAAPYSAPTRWLPGQCAGSG